MTEECARAIVKKNNSVIAVFDKNRVGYRVYDNLSVVNFLGNIHFGEPRRPRQRRIGRSIPA